MLNKLRLLLFFSCLSLFHFVSANGIDAVPMRSKPANACIAQNAYLRIIFDKSDGMPYKYELLKAKSFFWGENNGSKINAVVRKLSDHSESKADAVLFSASTDAGEARFKYKFRFNEAVVGTFEIHYSIKNSTVFVTLENVSESTGYHLIDVISSNLLTIRQEDGSSSFIYNNLPGRLVNLAQAKPGTVGEDNDVFGGYPNLSVLPVVAFLKSNAVCTMEVQGFCNKTVLDVANNGKYNRAMFGVYTPHYQRGGEKTPDLLIKQNEICRIDFSGDYDGNGTIDWLDAAKMVRDFMPEIPSRFYDDKYMWIVHGQVGRHEPQTSFDEVNQLIKRISALIDNNPQIAYVSGWCEGGHDTGYPNVQHLNPLLGGEKAFSALRQDAKKRYNTTVSFDDNYDDQYKNEFSKEYFKEDNIAKTIDGQLMTYNAWNGVDTSYITGMAHYMRPGGPGEARVDYTATKFGIEGTLLIDAATWWAIRPDYDPNHPASAATNLTDGKFKLFDRFQKKYNISVTSELLRYAAVGHITMVCDGPTTDGGKRYGDVETDIPFMSIALRKSIYYGCPGGEQGPNPIGNMLYNNTIRHGWLNKDVSDSFITDIYYTNFVPWFMLHHLDILSYVRKGDAVDMKLSRKSSIHLSKDSIVAEYEGNTIINNDDITCPLEGNRIAFYAKSQKTLSYRLPTGISASTVKATALYADHRENISLELKNSILTVKVPKQVPVIIYLNENSKN